MGTTTHARSYRKIVSSTAIFGSAQLIGVVLNLIRGKLVALILHSGGMGIMALLTNAGNTIQQLAMLGMNLSAVRNIAQAKEEGTEEVLSFTIRIVRSLFVLAAIFGLVLTLVTSPLVSQASFGSLDYLPLLLLLSVAVFLNILGSGEMAVMQGLRHYKRLAFCSIVPPVCGLLLSIPIYYMWGIEGIVPAMILSGAIYYLVIRYYSYHSNTHAKEKKLKLREVWEYGQDIIQLGMVMTFGTVVGTVTTYALTAFISNTGSVSDVGFYQAANVITVQYVSMIFAAMATDYYPRLSAYYKEGHNEPNLLVNQQTEVVLLSITPLAMLMILTAPFLISLLLTNEFQAIRHLIYYLGLANIFKALCFPMDYIAYAKGDKKYIFWIETVWGNAKTFIVIATGYLLFGLDGLGYGALLSAVIDVIVALIMTRLRYGFQLSQSAIQLLGILLLFALTCFGGAYVEDRLTSYLIMGGSTLGCIIFSLVMLNRRLNLYAIWKRMRGKR